MADEGWRVYDAPSMTDPAHPSFAKLAFAVTLAFAAPRLAGAETITLSEETDSQADIFMGLENRRFGQPDLGAESIWSGVFNVRTHEGEGVGTAGAVDLALGGGPGFYYVARLMFGPGIALPGNGRVAVRTGLGVSGLTGGRIGFGLELPVALEATVAAAEFFRPTFVLKPAFLFAEDARQEGTQFGFIDEFDALVALSFPTSREPDGASGFYLGVDYGERLGGRELGFVVGASIGVPSSPASRERVRLTQEQAGEEERQREERQGEERQAQGTPQGVAAPSSNDSGPTNNFIVGVVAYQDGLKIPLIIVGDLTWSQANASNALRCGSLYSEWSYQFSANDLESARVGARALDNGMTKVGAHYEVFMKGDQCSSPVLVR